MNVKQLFTCQSNKLTKAAIAAFFIAPFLFAASATLALADMTVDEQGNVGIGTNQPASLLHLKASGAAIMTFEGENQNVQSKILGHNGGLQFMVPYEKDFTFVVDSTDIVKIVNNGSGLHTFSDSRFKEVSGPITNALDKLNKIRGVNYRFKPGIFSDKKQIGLLAQEVEESFPEVVHTTDKGSKMIAYGSLIAPVIEALKELKAENDALKARLEALEAKQN